jgi:pimeloyl-ACP methyl ester carboxylesterase
VLQAELVAVDVLCCSTIERPASRLACRLAWSHRDQNARRIVGAMLGDDDLVTMQHVNAPYEGIPGPELAIVPGTSHFLLQEKPELCNRIIVEFLTQ